MAKNTQFSTPILYLIFNRPDLVKITFEKIREIKPKQLFIAADGPRENNPNDFSKCKKTREYILSKIDWDCELKTLFREKNLGCRYAVSSAITWFFENVEMGIVIEDDILPDSSFFYFCEELLHKYKDDERVMMISGTNYLKLTHPTEYSYFFSQYYAIWGWATWRRSWNLYDEKIRSWRTDLSHNDLLQVCRKKSMYDHYLLTFDLVKNNKIDTWDIQVAFSCLFNSGLSIIPKYNLVQNIGMIGTHGTGRSQWQFMETKEILVPLYHQKYMHPDYTYDSYMFDVVVKEKKASRLKVLIKRIIRLCMG